MLLAGLLTTAAGFQQLAIPCATRGATPPISPAPVATILRPRAASEKNLEALFFAFDGDQSGSIDKSELEQALDAMGINLSSERIDALFTYCDADGSGEIDLNEFKLLIQVRRRNHRLAPRPLPACVALRSRARVPLRLLAQSTGIAPSPSMAFAMELFKQ